MFCHERFTFHAASENQGGTNADAANQDDELGIEIVALHFGAGVVGKRRHENLIHGLFFRGSWLLQWRRSFAALGLCFVDFRGSGEAADFDLRRGRRSLCELQFAGAAGGGAAQSIQLSIADQNIRALRHDNTLRGELLLDANSAAGGANAHGSGGVEADERVLRRVTDGNEFGLKLRGVNGENRLVLDVCVNDAGIERQGQQVHGFQNGEVSRTADGDLSAFHEIDACVAGLHADVAAAAQDGPGSPLHDFDI